MSVVVPPEELQSVAAFDLVHPRELHDGLGQILTSLALRVEAAVYKIVEEALTNVMRHASAEGRR